MLECKNCSSKLFTKKGSYFICRECNHEMIIKTKESKIDRKKVLDNE